LSYKCILSDAKEGEKMKVFPRKAQVRMAHTNQLERSVNKKKGIRSEEKSAETLRPRIMSYRV